MSFSFIIDNRDRDSLAGGSGSGLRDSVVVAIRIDEYYANTGRRKQSADGQAQRRRRKTKPKLKKQ